MQAIELVRICREILKSMSKSDLRVNDYRHIEMYETYVAMANAGHKKEYIRTYLAEKFGTSESTVKRVIARLSRQVNS